MPKPRNAEGTLVIFATGIRSGDRLGRKNAGSKPNDASLEAGHGNARGEDRTIDTNCRSRASATYCPTAAVSSATMSDNGWFACCVQKIKGLLRKASERAFARPDEEAIRRADAPHTPPRPNRFLPNRHTWRVARQGRPFRVYVVEPTDNRRRADRLPSRQSLEDLQWRDQRPFETTPKLCRSSCDQHGKTPVRRRPQGTAATTCSRSSRGPAGDRS